MPLERSQLLYLLVILLVAGARLIELGISRRNLRRLNDAGGVEHGRAHYPFMVAVHAGLLVACPVEVVLMRRPWIAWLGWTMAVTLVATTATRLWVMATLGRRWTTRVVVLEAEQLVTSGPFRWCRHPNYLAVAVEVVALALLHCAWIAAVVFGLANTVVLAVRVQVENRALYPVSEELR